MFFTARQTQLIALNWQWIEWILKSRWSVYTTGWIQFLRISSLYHLPPYKTLETVKRNGKKQDTRNGQAQRKEITVAMCCNMTGTEKMDLVVIGKSKQPWALRKANTKLMKFLYFSNQTAWQNRSTFAEWLRHFDTKMHGRRVLLLLDNASRHYVASECYHVKLAFLPPNMTVHLHLLHVGKFGWMFS